MELRTLRYFRAVAEEQNFNRAAARLNLAQPALSRQIRGLEEELGFPLFTRLKRGVVLNPAGRSFLHDVTALLEGLALARERAEAIDGGQVGLLNVGVNAITYTNVHVMSALNSFQQNAPKVRLVLRNLPSPVQLDALERGEIDFGFLYLFNDHPRLNHIRIADYSMLLGVQANHPLAASSDVSLADLEGRPFVWGAPGPMSFINDHLLNECRVRGFDPNIVQRCAGADATLGLIGAGVGLGLVHSSVAERPHPLVKLVPIRDFQPSLPLSLAWRDGVLSAAGTAFLASIRQELNDGKVK